VARTTATNFAGTLQFPYATAGTDIFRKEDVQTLAQAVDQHDHSAGKGLVLSAASIPAGSITSAMIADGAIGTADIANHAVSAAHIAQGSASGPTTTSSTPVDMPDMTTTFTTTVATDLLCMFSGSFSLTGAGAIGVFSVQLDGSSPLVAYVQQVGINLTVSVAYVAGSVGIGAHTVKVQWWLIAAGTLSSSLTYRSLSVLEMRK